METHIDRADEVLVPHKQVRQAIAEKDGEDPCADKTLNRLLGRKLDELRASKRNAADISEDIVGNDERGGDEEPDQTLEDVVHDEVSLDDQEEEGHVRPSEHGELELVVSLLQGDDEEHEA